MIELPPIPTWNAIHPLIVHFPIALLLTAPVLILFGVTLAPSRGRGFFLAALVMMALGTVATFLASATGEAAGRVARRSAEIGAVLSRHESLADITRVVFGVLTIAFAVLLYGLERLETRQRFGVVVLPLLFLAFYGVGLLILVNTAYAGERLVHQFGVHAPFANASGTMMPGARSETARNGPD